ncbi:glycosyl hydrolase family 18 protein [Peribacillus glennii]|uniref:LysM peptidoglycan-binding domain-containing protein n=1 Tax=Peribacillus glennii TaxID=2303991 RepID=A0A372LIC1_9BACI|nr:glycosyl hydrolase family 18 protein [Peribacillus glennii]RFU65819.1 LysM peptidoglycan-binding domain-containing protein [Peribacillus glennii]
MKKIFGSFIVFCLLFVSIFPDNEGAAGKTLSIGTIKVEKAHVYSLPKQGSTIVSVLKKGEQYPVIATVAGDSASSIMHTVASGNTLRIIADQYGVKVAELQKANHLKTMRISVGQKLKIPQHYTVHKVVSGDTLYKLSVKYGVTVSDLTKLNNLKTTILTIRQKINIPDYYCQVQLLGGKKGWVKKSLLQQTAKKQIVMGWKYNGSADTYMKQMNQPNLNVVSPRTYSLNNTDTMVSVSVDTKYIEAAHAQGKQVWPLFGNRFDPVLTDSILSDPEKRAKVVRTLRDSLVQSGSDGINVDFENIHIKNKRDYVRFIGELKNALQPHGILVSVDVTRENGDPFWSGSLDRKNLGKIADYIIMMGYDEHWGGSPVAGSVASMPWTKEGIRLLKNDVPSHKIILGVPFYTREWVTNLSTNNVKSIDRTMAEAEQIISSKGLVKVWDKKTKQNYVEYTANGEKHQIWVEDKKSIELRMDIVRENHLGGAAAWYIGSETPDIWGVYHFN